MAAQTRSGDSLEALKPLVGAWRLVATFKDMPPADIGAEPPSSGCQVSGS